ncbi:MAG: DUF4139 domain-containing protein [Myxococcota bacterium]
MRATVVQATGEDWRGVALTLSSAPCERRLDVPELAALRLGTRQPRRATGWRPLPADLEALFPPELAGGERGGLREEDLPQTETLAAPLPRRRRRCRGWRARARRSTSTWSRTSTPSPTTTSSWPSRCGPTRRRRPSP